MRYREAMIKFGIPVNELKNCSESFLVEGLQIEDGLCIKLADVHRQPLLPIYDSDKSKINRPIVNKFMDAFDKQNFIENG